MTRQSPAFASPTPVHPLPMDGLGFIAACRFGQQPAGSGRPWIYAAIPHSAINERCAAMPAIAASVTASAALPAAPGALSAWLACQCRAG